MSPEQPRGTPSATPEQTPIEDAATRCKKLIDSQTYEILSPLVAESIKNMVDGIVLLRQDEEQPESEQEHEDLESLVASLGLNNKDETPDAISANPQPQTPNDTVDKIG